MANSSVDVPPVSTAESRDMTSVDVVIPSDGQPASVVVESVSEHEQGPSVEVLPAVSDVDEVLPEASMVQSLPALNSNCKQHDRPARPCPFCGELKVRVTRHLRSVHKNEQLISSAVKGGAKKQRAALRMFKREGIDKYNMSHIGDEQFHFQRERQSKSSIFENGVVCDKCKGVFSKVWFANHRKKCIEDACVLSKSVPAKVVYSSFDVSEQFKADVLSRFNSDEVGQFCQNDATMRLIGSKLYTRLKGRKDKQKEVRRSVMTDMRRLATLFSKFKVASLQNGEEEQAANSEKQLVLTDMFTQSNFSFLEEACLEQTKGEKEDKHGLMLSLYYLLVKCGRIIRVRCLVQGQKQQATAVAEFLELLKDEKHNLVGHAMYATNRNRQTKLRRPQELPKEADLTTLKEYTVNRMSTLFDDPYQPWTTAEFIEIRDLACCRITLFNARRGL